MIISLTKEATKDLAIVEQIIDSLEPLILDSPILGLFETSTIEGSFSSHHSNQSDFKIYLQNVCNRFYCFTRMVFEYLKK